MRAKVKSATQESIDFLSSLCEKEIISWPIDYEVFTPSDDELEETFGHWFGGNKWAANGDTFVQFGQDGTGSMFLLWFYPNLKAEPPVVFMGSEGESCLVSSDIDDFIKKISSGKLFYDGSWLDPDEEEKEELDWDKLRKAIESRFGKVSQTPEQLSENAKGAHPDFKAWVESNIEY